ncbi:DUF72 domain-containing protein [Umezawaea tangerina]|uniref:Uncharacterized protein YecE (DUF72 family) n=1 Tax=Umezawaea tangerina TaxID=84725 RepID=A0A2T0SCG7_9PSEU|nr:DUF72 domain-containing protein [Umezawaea tangerina]PRY31013.1 uncharacterized protein YecE (DUF72 family) [Umezawaea tangerina]
MHDIRIGTSGWTYPEWRDAFYPRGLPRPKELEHLAARVNSVEVNGTFYSLRSPTDYHSWATRTPTDFVLSVKGPKHITHTKRLHDVQSDLTAFFTSGISELGAKQGPVLWQLPPWLPFEASRLTTFLTQLPPGRHAVEARHSTFDTPEFTDLLHSHNIATVLADSGGKYPVLDTPTADFIYIRLHGPGELYVGDYSEAALEGWAERVRGWAVERDVFVYFDNTMSGAAPYNAMALSERLGIQSTPIPNGLW